jgi:ribosomal-protein-alanine N-acetyltransferase
MTTLLCTPRLALRRFTEADAQLIFELDRDPAVTRFTGPGHKTVEEYRLKIVNQILPYYARHPSRGFLIVEDRETGDFIGWFLLRQSTDYRYAAAVGWTKPEELEIGYRFKKQFWGRGLATEGGKALVEIAFDDPTTTAIVACAVVENRASTRVMEKLGMTESGRCELPDGYGPAVTYTRRR